MIGFYVGNIFVLVDMLPMWFSIYFLEPNYCRVLVIGSCVYGS